jgi:far upstream element-binding protein
MRGTLFCKKNLNAGHYADRCPNPRADGPTLPGIPDVPSGPEITRVVQCPNDKVGLLIGKGGSTHRTLQETTHCRVHIPKASEPGVDYREIQITGGEVEVQACEAMIADKLGDVAKGGPRSHESAPGPRPGEVQFVVQCPNENVGMIIGKQGATFRMLQETTGCQVTIPKTSAPGMPYREITLTGNQGQVGASARRGLCYLVFAPSAILFR